MEYEYQVKTIIKGARNYVLRLYPLKEKIDYLPGQFINLIYNNIERSYSIASIPSFPYLELFITNINGEFTSKLDEIYEKILIIKGPFGRFTYSNQNKAVFISTGSGIAPIISILRHIYSSKIDGDFYLFSSFKYREENIYESELRLFKNMGLNLELRYTQEGDSRFTSQEFLRFLDYDFYVCGNREFALSIAKEVKPSKLHIEAWG